MYSCVLVSILLTVVSVFGSSSLQNKAITNGKPAKINNFAYQVSLAFDGKHICGGVIISYNYILTAVHCFFNDDPARYKVRVGSNRHDRGGFVYDVKYFVKNNVYEVLLDEKKLFDIALILVKKITFDKLVQPIALPSQSDVIPFSKEGTVSGWGATVAGGKASDELLYTNTKIWRRADCKKVFGKRKIKNAVFCAGDRGRDSCRGDSGGPFVYNGKLIGLVSYGRGCGRENVPGVYTNVIANLKWIQLTIKYIDSVKSSYLK